MRGILMVIEAWDRVANACVPVRVGASRNALTLGADGLVWEPSLLVLPRLAMQLSDDDMTGQLQFGSGTATINVSTLRNVANAALLEFKGAPIRIYSGDGAQTANMRVEFSGRIIGGTPNADSGQTALSFEVDKAVVDVPLLNLTYGGGGGADGDVEIRGRNKPACFGRPINIAPVLIDAVNAVYQFDGYGNASNLAGVYEDLASFGASLGDYPTYAALVAADIPAGRFATCITAGMFRLGADATGVITCDPVCGSGTPGTLMLRWLRTHAAVPESRIRAGDFASFDAQLMARIGAVPPVSYFTTADESVLELWQRLAGSCNGVPLLLLDGTISVARVPAGPVALTLDRQGGSPLVTAWQSSDAPLPWWKQKTQAAQSFYVNGPSEIDFEDDLNDLGDWKEGETYRQGNIVRYPPDGRRYFYVASAPSAIPPPAVGYWDIWEEAPDARVITYEDGTPLEDLKPAAPGADVTGDNTAKNSNALAGREGNFVLQDILTNAGNVASVAADVGYYKLDIEPRITADDGGTLKERVYQWGYMADQNDLFIKNLQRIDPEAGTANAMFSVGANGVIAAANFFAGGTQSVIGFYSDQFYIWDRNGGAEPIQIAVAENGQFVARDLVAAKFKALSVDTATIALFAIGVPWETELANNVTLPYSSGSIAVASINLTKDIASSSLAVEWMMRMRPGGQYAGYFELSISGSGVVDTVYFWIASANIGGVNSTRGVQPYRRRFYNIPAGSVTVSLRFVYDRHDGGTGTGFIEAGSSFLVEELKR